MTELDSIKIQRSYKFRCTPNRAQRKQLAIEFGHARWVWNQCLAWRTHAYKEYSEKVTAIDFSRELTFLKKLGTYDWLKEASATCLAQKLRDQEVAFKNFLPGVPSILVSRNAPTPKVSATSSINGRWRACIAPESF